MVDLRLVEFKNNLRNFDFDILGSYKIDKNEADKIIAAIENMDIQWKIATNSMYGLSSDCMCASDVDRNGEAL